MKARKAVFFDVDGTLTTGHVWKAIMDYFKKNRLRRATNIYYWAYHSPSFFLFKLGLISQNRFRWGWAKHLAWFFKGYSEGDAENVWDLVINDFLPNNWRKDIVDILRSHKQAGDLVVLVSGGPTPLVRRIASQLGADYGVGTDLIITNGHFTGKSGHVCQDQNKVMLSKKMLNEKEIEVDFKASLAYADSSGDIALFEMVGNPVAVHPDKYLMPIAKERGWKIIQ